MTAAIEMLLLPVGVVVGGAMNDPDRLIELRGLGMNCDGKQRAQIRATVMPVDVGKDIAAWTVRPKPAPFFPGDTFFIFLLRQFFLGVPRESMDAARLDGASEFRIWWQIVLPQVCVAFVIVALFAIVYTWQKFFSPLIYLKSREDFPLSAGLFTFRSQRAIEWSISMMGATPTALPMIVLFLFTQRFFVRCLATSGLE